MPLQPDAVAFLERMKHYKQPFDMTIEDYRMQAAELIHTPEPSDDLVVENVTIAGGDGQEMIVRIYRPTAGADLPVVVWMHGGSFSRGTLDMFDAGRRRLVHDTDIVIVAVDQRLAPEFTFPKPMEDGLAAIAWARANIARYGGDPAKLGIGGESSGANQAAGLALMTNDRGDPQLAFQILLGPLLDATLASPAVEEFGEGYMLTKAQLRWSRSIYAPGLALDDRILSPLFASDDDLAQVPPAAIITIEYDPTRDDGKRYADRLEANGVPVEFVCVEGYVHHYQGPNYAETIAGSVLRLFERIFK